MAIHVTIDTFAAARAKHLELLEEDFATLRNVVNSPELCNTGYPPLGKALEAITDRVRAIVRLNGVAWECKSLGQPQ